MMLETSIGQSEKKGLALNKFKCTNPCTFWLGTLTTFGMLGKGLVTLFSSYTIGYGCARNSHVLQFLLIFL